MEINSDALDWGCPLLLWLLASAGLPAGVESGQIMGSVEVVYEGEDPPHHALLDARLLAEVVDRSNCAFM